MSNGEENRPLVHRGSILEDRNQLEAEWFSLISQADGYALAALVKAAYALAKRGSSVFKRFPNANIHGQLVYTHIQDQLLSLLDTDSIWRPSLERHPKGTTFFVALTTALYRLHVAKTDGAADDPHPRLFLDVEQAKQLEFNLGVSTRRIIELVHGGGEDKHHPGEPAHMGIRFIDGQGGYHLGYIDLKSYLRAAEMPHVEDQSDDFKIPPREEEEPGADAEDA